MSGRAAKQRNDYVGNPPRALLRVTVGAPSGRQRELCVIVDTGNGGDADAFWLRRPRAPRLSRKRKP